MSHPDLVPMIITDDLDATRRFYLDDIGASAVIEMDHYLQVRIGDDPDTRELAFMPPQPEASPIGAQVPFAGGLVVSIAVGDADKFRAGLLDRGIDAAEPTDKPWGWRSVVLRDPNGVTLDFFHAIAEDPAQDAPR